MSELQAKPKVKRGRPKKYLNPEKAFEWFDESAYIQAEKDFQEWEELFEKCKTITGTEFEKFEDFENELRAKYPELEKLDIRQLYIMDNKDRVEIERAFLELSYKAKPSLDKDEYTVKVPAKHANEYSYYLAIAEAFNNIRAMGNTNINIAQLPNLTGNRIVLDVREMRLRPNAYHFTENYR